MIPEDVNIGLAALLQIVPKAHLQKGNV